MLKNTKKIIRHFSKRASERMEKILTQNGVSVKPSDMMYCWFELTNQDKHMCQLLHGQHEMDDPVYFEKKTTKDKNGTILHFIVVPSGIVNIRIEDEIYSYQQLDLIHPKKVFTILIRRPKSDKLSKLSGYDLTESEIKLINKTVKFLSPLFAKNYYSENWTPHYYKDLQSNVCCLGQRDELDLDRFIKIFENNSPDILRIFMALTAANLFCKMKDIIKPRFLTTIMIPQNLELSIRTLKILKRLIRMCDFCHRPDSAIFSPSEIKLQDKKDFAGLDNYRNRLLLLSCTKTSVLAPAIESMQQSLAALTCYQTQEYPFSVLPIFYGRVILPHHVALNIEDTDALLDLDNEDFSTLRNALVLILKSTKIVLNTFEIKWDKLCCSDQVVSLDYQSAWLNCLYESIESVLFQGSEGAKTFESICRQEETERLMANKMREEEVANAMHCLLNFNGYIDHVQVEKPESHEEADKLLDFKFYAFIYKTSKAQFLCFTESSLQRCLNGVCGLDDDLFEVFIDFLKDSNIIKNRTENIYFSSTNQKRFIKIPIENEKRIEIPQ